MWAGRQVKKWATSTAVHTSNLVINLAGYTHQSKVRQSKELIPRYHSFASNLQNGEVVSVEEPLSACGDQDWSQNGTSLVLQSLRFQTERLELQGSQRPHTPERRRQSQGIPR